MKPALAPPVSDRIGQYEIVRKLKSGGMGAVYLGRRRGPAGFVRDVVIKVIHPHLGEEERFVRMFMDEARLAARISHPNVVQVEELGEERGMLYLVMERVDGCSLYQIIRQAVRRGTRIPVAAAVHVAMEAALGLHAAHEATGMDDVPLGIVHRDVSPSNILVSRDGNVKVIDFGIAKANGTVAVTHASHGLKGKLRYMSPEQAWGWSIDRRSDIYSLGVVLWEALSQRPLFKAPSDLALLEKVREPQVPSPSSINPDVPLGLDQAIARATARSPDERPATAAELRALLARAVPEALTIEPELLGELAARGADEAPAASVFGATPDGDDDRPTTPDHASLRSNLPVRVPRRRRAVILAVVFGGLGVAASGLAAWWHRAEKSGGDQAQPSAAFDRSEAPAETAPAETAPAEIAPAEIAPAESAPTPSSLPSPPGPPTPARLVEDTRPEPAPEVERPAEPSKNGRARTRVTRDRRRIAPASAEASKSDGAAVPAESETRPREAPRPQRVGRTPIADEFETDSTPIVEEPEFEKDKTPIAEEFEQ
jgi:eukaryotic-like serine/threonine-protein kinase